MNDYLLLTTNACVLVTMNYIALRLKHRLSTAEILAVPLFTGLASLLLLLIPVPSGLLAASMGCIPLMMAGLRYGLPFALAAAVLPTLYLTMNATPMLIIARELILPLLAAACLHRPLYRLNTTPLRLVDGIRITALLLPIHWGVLFLSVSSVTGMLLMESGITVAATGAVMLVLIAMYNDENRIWLRERELELKANQDGMTHLPNLQSFLPIARQALARERITLLMIDIDNFKKHNDSLGHVEGDHLLCEVGKVLQEAIGPQHYLARYGGEEFIVLCHESEPWEIEVLAASLCESIRQHRFSVQNRRATHSITISIGCATAEETGEPITELIEKADQALYCSKAAGKDTYTLYEHMRKIAGG